jgi:hypothetical protein
MGAANDHGLSHQTQMRTIFSDKFDAMINSLSTPLMRRQIEMDHERFRRK